MQSPMLYESMMLDLRKEKTSVDGSERGAMFE